MSATFPRDLPCSMAAIVPRQLAGAPLATRAKFRFGSTWNCVKQSAVSLLLHGPRCGGEDHAGQNPHRKAVIERGEWRGGYAIPATGKNRPSGYAGVPTTGWRIDRTIGTGTAKAPNTAENAEAARFGINSAIRAGMPGSSTTPYIECCWAGCMRDLRHQVPRATAFQHDATRCYHPLPWSRRTARSK